MPPPLAQAISPELLRTLGLGAAALVVLIALGLCWRSWFRRQPAWRFERQPALFNPTEIRFLLALQQAVGPDLVIVGKVRLADLIRPSAHQSPSQRQGAFHKIRGQHIDFVLLDPSDFVPVLALELDAPGDPSPAQLQRSTFIDAACADADLPLMLCPVRPRYNIEELRQLIAQAITNCRSR